ETSFAGEATHNEPKSEDEATVNLAPAEAGESPTTKVIRNAASEKKNGDHIDMPDAKPDTTLPVGSPLRAFLPQEQVPPVAPPESNDDLSSKPSTLILPKKPAKKEDPDPTVDLESRSPGDEPETLILSPGSKRTNTVTPTPAPSVIAPNDPTLEMPSQPP